jgi:hypothetical protein
MATLHLLGLPRELRDIIYGYVHREVAVQRWVYRLDHHQRPLYRSEDFAFSGVPIPDLLLVNTQIHDEYLEAPCFRVISADVTLPTYWDRVDDAVSEPTKEATRRLEGLLPRVGYLTIMDTEAMDNVVSYPYLWTGAIEFEKLFPRQPLRLRSVAILLRKMNRTLYLHTDVAAALQYINANTDKSMAPPTTYADLPCVLNSIGLQIEFYRCSPCGHLYGYAPSAGSVHIVPGGEHDVYHSISKFELCIYGTDEPSADSTHLLSRLQEKLGPRRHPDEVLEVMDEAEKADMASWSVQYWD